MSRLIIILLLCFCSLPVSAIDIKKACEERDEQRNALLNKMSTSITEAFLAGHCVGYEKTYYLGTSIDNLSEACSEFIERKEALLPFDISTTLSEAAKAGMCIGAIYKVAKSCDIDEKYIRYLNIARGIRHMDNKLALVHITTTFGCDKDF